MQRWIALGVLAVMLFLGGGYYGYRVMKQNRPQPIWVPLPIREDLEVSKRDAIVKELKEKLSDPAILTRVSKDLGLKSKWNLASDQECAKELERRLFVKAGHMDTPNGKVPAIHVGVKGKVKEMKVSGEIAMRLMEDVSRILGIKLPPKKQS